MALEDLLSGVRSRLLAGAFGLGVLVSCGSPTDSGGGDGGGGSLPPPPVNSSMVVDVAVPDSYRWDEPVAHGFSVSDADTLASGSVVRYLVDEEVVWERLLGGVVGWDTSWTPRVFSSDASLGSSASSRVEYFLEDSFVGGSEVREGSVAVAVLPSRLTEFVLRAEDFFSGSGLDGFVTFSGHRRVSLSSGEGFVSRELGVDRDSLSSGLYRVLGEFDGYPVHSSVLESSGADSVSSLRVVPYSVGSWDFSAYQGILREPRFFDSPGFVDGRFSTRFPAGAEIVNYMYDERYSIPTSESHVFFTPLSLESDSLAPPGFFTDVFKATEEVLSLIPASQGISASYVFESEGAALPDRPNLSGPGHFILNGGWVDAPFGLTHSDRSSEGYVTNASLFLQTPTPRELQLETIGAHGAVRRDVIESYGLRTSKGAGNKLTVRESIFDSSGNILPFETTQEFTPFAKQVMEVFYSRPALSGFGELSGRGLPNSSGGYTTFIEDWVADPDPRNRK